MPKTTRVNVDIRDIAEAIANGSPGIEYYLDLETGEIVWLADDIVVEEDRGIREAIEAGIEERFVDIPYVHSHEGYRDMKDFIDTLVDDSLREKLYIAIDGRGAFRRFKDVLLSYPEEREKWFEFSSSRNLQRAKAWLEERGIEAIRADDR